MGWKRQWQDVQDRDGNPLTPGQWIEQGSIVFLVGLTMLVGFGMGNKVVTLGGRLVIASGTETACMLGERFCCRLTGLTGLIVREGVGTGGTGMWE